VLVVPREIALPEPPLALVAHAERTRPAEVAFEIDGDTDEDVATVGDDGRARLSVPWPGDYELAWSVRHTGTGIEWKVEQERQSIHADEAGAATTVDAHLDPDALARALAGAR